MRSPFWSAIITFIVTLVLGLFIGVTWLASSQPFEELRERSLELSQNLYKVACAFGAGAFVWTYAHRHKQDPH